MTRQEQRLKQIKEKLVSCRDALMGLLEPEYQMDDDQFLNAGDACRLVGEAIESIDCCLPAENNNKTK